MADLNGNMKIRLSKSRLSGERALDSVTTESEISTERCFPLGKTHENRLNASEDGLNMIAHDSQHRTESSCSNSLPIVLPVSFSNQCYQDTSKEAYLFRNCGSSMDSSNSKAFDRSPEEPVTASSESGVSAQIAGKAIRNARARNSMQISSRAGNHCSVMTKKGDEEISHKWDLETTTPDDDVGEVLEQADMYKWISRNTSSTNEQIPGAVGKNSVCSDNIDCFNCRTETVKSTRVQVGFDLNEDINANVIDDGVRPIVSTPSSHNVIHVIAKAGILVGQPMIPLKFEGGLGWKGSAETSAFHRPKDTHSCTGIDLNVAAIEGNDGNGFPVEHELVSSPSTLQDSHSEVDSKQAKSPWIDLNCLYDAADESTQPSLQPKSEIFHMNLNSRTSVEDKSNNVHWLGRGLQSQANMVSDTSVPRKQDFNFTSHDYLASLSTMRHLANSGHTLVVAPNFVEPMHRVATMHPKLPLISHGLPPQSCTYRDPFHLGVGSMPYNRYYHEHGIFQEALNPAMHASFDAPHLVHEQSISKLDNKTEYNLSGSKMDEPRQFPFLARNSPMGERTHQEAWYAASVKRKEPEGGIECFQLGHKQVT